MGEILEADEKLRSTAEGRTYEGFTAFLNDADQQARFSAAIHTGEQSGECWPNVNIRICAQACANVFLTAVFCPKDPLSDRPHP